jgi:hypothetical protein
VESHQAPGQIEVVLLQVDAGALLEDVDADPLIRPVRLDRHAEAGVRPATGCIHENPDHAPERPRLHDRWKALGSVDLHRDRRSPLGRPARAVPQDLGEVGPSEPHAGIT